jgi:hypothetical protein
MQTLPLPTCTLLALMCTTPWSVWSGVAPFNPAASTMLPLALLTLLPVWVVASWVLLALSLVLP